MSAKKRCSNCEKSVDSRTKEGKIYVCKACKATGEKISGKEFYYIRHCDEFLPRQEYIYQFESPIDKAMGLIEKGKKIKEIVDGIY